MDDLRSVGVHVSTLGQYLQPTPKHLPVAEFVHPDTFKELEEIGLEKGFMAVESGLLVRSSYHAEKACEVKRFIVSLTFIFIPEKKTII